MVISTLSRMKPTMDTTPTSGLAGNPGSAGNSVRWAGPTSAIRSGRRQCNHLTAIAPTVTTPQIYGNWFYIDGAFHYGFAFPWGGVSIDGHVAQYNTGNDWTTMFRHLPIVTSTEAAYHRTEHYKDRVAHPTRDAYWDGISSITIKKGSASRR
jgi:hypothetical protein